MYFHQKKLPGCLRKNAICDNLVTCGWRQIGVTIYCSVQAGRWLMAQCIVGNFRNKSTARGQYSCYCYDVFFPFPSCTANILSCIIVFVYYECDMLELGKIFLLDSIWSILFFCSVLYFCIYPSTVEKKGKILDLLLNQKKQNI